MRCRRTTSSRRTSTDRPPAPIGEVSLLGAPAVLHVQLNPTKQLVSKEIVTAFDPTARRFAWGLDMKPGFLLAAERWQVVEPLGPDRCRYRAQEDMTGLLAAPDGHVADATDCDDTTPDGAG